MFKLNGDTRFLRGDESVSLADPALQEGDEVELVINHDTPGDIALEVRLLMGP